jgi:VIT1/CCC1 family predicted Fe2+/Mn2+ transporter
MSTDARERDYHEREDPHHRESPLVDVLLGGQDGVVNVLGVILGVAAATLETRVVLAAGIATAVAESLSMAAVAYTSAIAEGDLYASERAREYRHIANAPALEREEIRELYRKKGFDGELLERIVATITANPDVWVALMMTEEHGRAPVSRRAALKSAIVVGVAAAVGSLVPIVPFLFMPIRAGAWAAAVVAALTLFALGAYKAKLTALHPARAGLEIAAIGMIAALAGWGVGLLFQAPPM